LRYYAIYEDFKEMKDPGFCIITTLRRAGAVTRVLLGCVSSGVGGGGKEQRG
jgi:hypothetical protein